MACDMQADVKLSGVAGPGAVWQGHREVRLRLVEWSLWALLQLSISFHTVLHISWTWKTTAPSHHTPFMMPSNPRPGHSPFPPPGGGTVPPALAGSLNALPPPPVPFLAVEHHQVGGLGVHSLGLAASTHPPASASVGLLGFHNWP